MCRNVVLLLHVFRCLKTRHGFQLYFFLSFDFPPHAKSATERIGFGIGLYAVMISERGRV